MPPLDRGERGRIPEVMARDPLEEPTLFGVIEVDETNVGGKATGKGRGYRGNNIIVAGGIQRSGSVRLERVPSVPSTLKWSGESRCRQRTSARKARDTSASSRRSRFLEKVEASNGSSETLGSRNHSKKQVVAQLLAELALAAHGVEGDEQARLEQVLGRDRGAPSLAVHRERVSSPNPPHHQSAWRRRVSSACRESTGVPALAIGLGASPERLAPLEHNPLGKLVAVG